MRDLLGSGRINRSGKTAEVVSGDDKYDAPSAAGFTSCQPLTNSSRRATCSKRCVGQVRTVRHIGIVPPEGYAMIVTVPFSIEYPKMILSTW